MTEIQVGHDPDIELAMEMADALLKDQWCMFDVLTSLGWARKDDGSPVPEDQDALVEWKSHFDSLPPETQGRLHLLGQRVILVVMNHLSKHVVRKKEPSRIVVPEIRGQA